MVKTRALFLLSALALTACASPEQKEAAASAAVAARASFDMNCPAQNIKTAKLQDDGHVVKFGAEGCGKKSVYDTIRTNVYIEGAAPQPQTTHTHHTQTTIIKQSPIITPYGTR